LYAREKYGEFYITVNPAGIAYLNTQL